MVRRLQGPTLRQVRILVDRLCTFYEDEVPALAAKATERRERKQAELAIAEPPVLHNGIWVFPESVRHPDEPAERSRRRALSLPDYYEVAHLLVRRHLVTEADLAELPPMEGPA